MKPTNVAVLYTFFLGASAYLFVKPTKIGMLPNGSTIMKRAMAALPTSDIKSNKTSLINTKVY